MDYTTPPTGVIPTVPELGIPSIKQSPNKAVQNKRWHLTGKPSQSAQKACDRLLIDTVLIVQLQPLLDRGVEWCCGECL